MQTFRISMEAVYPNGGENQRTVEAAVEAQIGPEIDNWYKLHVGARIKSEVVVEPERTTTVVPLTTFKVNMRAAVYATKTMVIDAVDEADARRRALLWSKDGGEDPQTWDLDFAEAPFVESVE